MIDDEDIIFTDLSNSQDTLILELVTDFLNSQGPTPINSLCQHISLKTNLNKSIIRETITDACKLNFIIHSKKVTKLLGEYIISLK
jgi:hypothetical protein